MAEDGATGFGRTRALFTLIAGGTALGFGVFVHWHLGVLPNQMVFAALGGAVAGVLGAWFSRPARGHLSSLGWWPIAGVLAIAMPVLALFDPLLSVELAGAGAETAGGLAIAQAALRWGQARLASKRTGLSTKKKYQLHEDEKKPTKIKFDALAPGQHIELSKGQVVPFDGRAIETGSVRSGPVTGHRHLEVKRKDDLVLAGSVVESESLHVEVVHAPGSTFYEDRMGRLATLSEEVTATDRVGRAAAGAIMALAAVSLGACFYLDPTLRIIPWLPTAAGLMLAAAAGAPALARAQGRARALKQLAAGGVILSRPTELDALTHRRRWFVEPTLVAAPGSVDALPFTDISPAELLRVAGALLDEERGPIAASIESALSSRELQAHRPAALRRSQAVYHGTAAGVRWFLGPRAAVEEEESAELDSKMNSAIEELKKTAPVVWLLGRADKDATIVGALAINVSAKGGLSTAAKKLEARLLPGLPDVVRGAVAEATEISADAPPLKKSDGSLIRYREMAPSAGTVLRSLRDEDALNIDFSASPMIFEGAVERLPVLLEQARTELRRGTRAAVLLTVLPVGIAGVLAALGYFNPILGTAFALGALTLGARVSKR